MRVASRDSRRPHDEDDDDDDDDAFSVSVERESGRTAGWPVPRFE